MSQPHINIDQPPPEWLDPTEDFTFKPAPISVPWDWQAEKLTLCGLSPEAFGDTVDPSFFIALGIRAGIANGISAEGNVNMLQRLVQHRPARLGEPLRVQGMHRPRHPGAARPHGSHRRVVRRRGTAPGSSTPRAPH